MTRDILAHRYAHRSRVFIETFSKLVLAGAIAFFLAWHAYTAALLAAAGVIPELIWPTLVFDVMLGGGVLLLLVFAGAGKHGPVAEWLACMVAAVVAIFLWIWTIEIVDPFGFGILYFPLASILLVAWLVALVIAAGHVIGVGIGALVTLPRKKARVVPRPARARIATVFMVVVPVVLVLLAQPVALLVANVQAITRHVTLVDTNVNATLSIWDDPRWSAQVGTSQDINLGLLDANQTRAMEAFKLMNTTFYENYGFATELQANATIARLKMLDAYDLQVVWTIWHESHDDFPGPDAAQDWIDVARSTLEFIIASNITNVVGICADSERSGDLAPGQYWENIDLYDAFLREVQENASLRNPNPRLDTFETVLCYGPLALIDFIDGDQDLVVQKRQLGLPPSSWTKYHFMLYRYKQTAPSWLYNQLVLAERYIGTATAAPIVGLTGTDWFADGYLDGTYNLFGGKPLGFPFDGIDGWDAMKREILFCKAMGFHTVSVFHFRGYGDPTVPEYNGFWEYYGVGKLEDLAASWHAGETVNYPISSLAPSTGRRGLFPGNTDFPYDVLLNIENAIVLATVLAAVAAFALVKVVKGTRRPRDGI